jgi:hypothetical protein
MERKLSWLLGLAIFVFLLSNCVKPEKDHPTDAIAETDLPSITESVGPTWIPTVTPTSEIKQKSPTPTVTIIPTNTVTPQPSPTWTPLPILLGTEKEERLLDLYRNNSGCDFPCWWGIVPGKTTWDQARHIIAPFADEIGEGFLIPEPIFGQKGRVTAFFTRYSLPYSVDVGSVGFFITEDPIFLISIYGGTELSYQLNQLLAKYGPPEEVWVQGWPYNDDRIPHYALLVLYPSKGIMARYDGDASLDRRPKDTMLLCPGEQGPKIKLWEPGREDAKELKQSLIEYENDTWAALPFLPLAKATEMDIDAFYQQMLDPEACLTIPVKIWDDQGDNP